MYWPHAEDSFCRICSPIAELWGKCRHGKKWTLLRPICSPNDFQGPTASYAFRRRGTESTARRNNDARRASWGRFSPNALAQRSCCRRARSAAPPTCRVALAIAVRTWSMFLAGRAVDGQQHVARLHAGHRGSGAARLLDHAGPRSRPPRGVPRHRAGAATGPACPCPRHRRRAPACCPPCRWRRPAWRSAPPACPGATPTAWPAGRAAAWPTQAGRSPEATMAWPFTWRITSPVCSPAFSAGLPLLDAGHQRAFGLVELEGFGKRLVHLLHSPRPAGHGAPCRWPTIWSLILAASSMGMANDTPW